MLKKHAMLLVIVMTPLASPRLWVGNSSDSMVVESAPAPTQSVGVVLVEQCRIYVFIMYLFMQVSFYNSLKVKLTGRTEEN